MALGLTQHLTALGTRNLSEDEEQQARKADNLAVFCPPIVYKTWEPPRLTTLWASTACYGDSFHILNILFGAVLGYCTRLSVSQVVHFQMACVDK
jgi:hypothetical protein